MPSQTNAQDVDILDVISETMRLIVSRRKDMAEDKPEHDSHISLSCCAKLPDAEFLFYIYRNLLGRIPTFTEYVQHIADLKENSKSRMDIFQAIKKNCSLRTSNAPMIFDATEEELQYVTSNLYATEKYMTLDDFKASNIEEFVKIAYLCILRREPDPLGFVSYCKEMQHGMPHKEVLNSLLKSEEAAKYGQQIVVGVTSPEVIDKLLLAKLNHLSQRLDKLEYEACARQGE